MVNRPSDHPDTLDGDFGELLEAVFEGHLDGDGTIGPVEHSGVSTETDGQLFRSVVRPADVLVLLSVPLVLVGAFAVPLELRQALAFSYSDPTLLTAFTANFVHLNAAHLAANLAAYALVVPLVYLLSVMGGTRRRFFVVFTVFVLVFPVVLSTLNLAVARPGYMVGFSGVTMAFLGFLPLALSSFLATHFEFGWELDLSAVLFFVGLALIAVLTVQSLLTVGLAAVALMGAVLYTLPLSTSDGGFRPDIRGAVEVPGFVELAVAAVVLFAGVLVIAFPADPVVDVGVVNLYVHLLGFALGFISTYATVATMDRLSLTDPRFTG